MVDISSRDESSELKNNTNVTVSAPATPEPESAATSPQTKKRTADDAALEGNSTFTSIQRLIYCQSKLLITLFNALPCILPQHQP